MSKIVVWISIFVSLAAPFSWAQTSIEFARPLSAANFFQPLRESQDRNPKWPARLELTDKTVTIPELKTELLKHSWRGVFHCNGTPVSAEYLASVRTYDGFSRSGMDFKFSKSEVQRTDYLYPDSPVTEVDPDVNDTQGYHVFLSQDMRIRMTFEDLYGDEAPRAWLGVWIKVVYIPLTDETLVEFESAKKLCPDGSPLRHVLVPMDLLL